MGDWKHYENKPEMFWFPLATHEEPFDFARPFFTGSDGNIIVAIQENDEGVMLIHTVQIDGKSCQ